MDYEAYQLVGFSNRLVVGNNGILNMTLACQEAHPGSRICSVSEIGGTLTVPVPPFYGYAWVQFGSQLRSNCLGWTSNSPSQAGLTIELGPQSGCYGGFVARTCDQQLPVACCARLVPEEPNP